MNQQNNALKVIGIIVLVVVFIGVVWFLGHKGGDVNSGKVINTNPATNGSSHPIGMFACGSSGGGGSSSSYCVNWTGGGGSSVYYTFSDGHSCYVDSFGTSCPTVTKGNGGTGGTGQ